MKVMSPTMLAFLLRENRPAGANSAICNNVNMKKRTQQHRLMVGRANNRSGIHGTHLPTTDTLDNVEEVKREINKGKKEKEEKRKNVEETVDSHLSRSDQNQKSPTK
ncbi:hypothetical protein BVRB_7g169020 [Beta vulgaris subsp. vulgaris]|nr:hypothetical protein BVRB_7g169020 [Beta vulgaris subsp. vulgaris]